MADLERFLTKRNKLFDHGSLDCDIGWLYDIAITRLKEALYSAIESQTADTPLRPDVYYTVHKELNASAWHSEYPGGCSVAIYSSTPILMFMACIQYANLCDLKTAMPITEAEKLVVHTFKVKIKNKLAVPIKSAYQVNEVLDKFSKENTTNNPLGLFLCELAMKFIAMHECMHVILGHTRYISEHYKMTSFLEFQKFEKKNSDPAFFQTLEFIADRHTIRGLYVRLLQNDYDDFYKGNLLANITVHKDVFLVRCLMQACCVLFHLFPGNNLSIFKNGTSHPHPYVRARWLCIELMQELSTANMDKYEPLTIMTWSAAHLSTNFKLSGNWEKASDEDYMSNVSESFTDHAYDNIQTQAAHWQSYLLKEYGPVYH